MQNNAPLSFKGLRPPSYASQWFDPLPTIHQTPHTLALEHATTLKLSTYQLINQYTYIVQRLCTYLRGCYST